MTIHVKKARAIKKYCQKLAFYLDDARDEAISQSNAKLEDAVERVRLALLDLGAEWRAVDDAIQMHKYEESRTRIREYKKAYRAKNKERFARNRNSLDRMKVRERLRAYMREYRKRKKAELAARTSKELIR